MVKEYLQKLIENQTLINYILTFMIGAGMTLGLKKFRKRSDNINNSASKDDLEEGIKNANRYAEKIMKVHEDKQILELGAIADKVNSTHDMVTKLLDIQLMK